MQPQEMTPADINFNENQIQEKMTSTDLLDNICGILMDTSIGRIGLRMDYSKIKAEAIVKLIEKTNNEEINLS